MITTPKFDGSCLVISSNLIKSGVQIPHAITHCAEDTSLAEMAKLIMGNMYRQFCITNILRVHNRRHPKKRLYVKNENNPMGFNGEAKGEWWNVLSNSSKHNLSILLRNQKSFISIDDILQQISNHN